MQGFLALVVLISCCVHCIAQLPSSWSNLGPTPDEAICAACKHICSSDEDGGFEYRTGKEDMRRRTIATSTIRTIDCSDYKDACCDNSESSEEETQRRGCGYRNVNGISFSGMRINANVSQYGEFPWVIAVMWKKSTRDTSFKYKCGGSLIHPKVVLTAAHSIYQHSADTLKINAGEWDRSNNVEFFPNQEKSVAEVIVHEHFNNLTGFNDIALLILQNPVILSENVQTVCLPPSGFNFDNARCFGTGWGKDKFGVEGKRQKQLKKIDLPIVPNDRCEAILRTTRLYKYFELHDSFMCAGGEVGKDMCEGDGGSPLNCPIPGRDEQYYQAGIVSWGLECGDNAPGVYTKLSEFRKWIDNQFADRKIETRYYIP